MTDEKYKVLVGVPRKPANRQIVINPEDGQPMVLMADGTYANPNSMDLNRVASERTVIDPVIKDNSFGAGSSQARPSSGAD